ncbi:MAG TPA: XRE family transcriptional regulator [Lachnospiraceae bacterium]|nr:XRE family transcriptional regulator [Lachnospiraceae bacterium]
MGIAERIQQLRKSRGISQEELAEKAGVSRQAVSKWESGQSTPDVEKISLLSDFFETTTDYLIKGIEPVKESEGKWSAVAFAGAGTVVNAIGLIFAVFIWLEQQRMYATGIGLAIMLLGTGIFFTGQLLKGKEKAKAKQLFVLVNIWILPFIPLSCCYNIWNGRLSGGIYHYLAPVPLLVNSVRTYALYWAVYIGLCAVADIAMVRKNKV